MATVRKSLVFSFVQSYGITLVQFVSSLVIARLLTPDEIGVFSVGVAFIAIAHAVRDFGVSNYIVQERDFTEAKKAAALQIAFVVSWGLAAVLIVFSMTVGQFYEDARVSKVLAFLSINFLLLPLSSVGLAILRRNMQFDRLCYIHLFSGFVQAAVSIGSAYLGQSYMSLVWGSISGILVTVLFTLYLTPMGLVGRFCKQTLKEVAGKGMNLSFASILYELGSNFSEMIIGKTMGFATVGFFGKAIGVVQLVDKVLMGAVRPILLPSYSEKSRLNALSDQVALDYLDLVLVVVWPMLLWIAFNAELIILILFGDQWLFAAKLVPVLCLMGGAKYIGSVIAPLITATGHINYLVRFQMQIMLLKIALVTPAAFITIEMVCWSLFAAELVGLFILLFYVNKCLVFSSRKLWMVMIRSAGIVGVLAAGLKLFFNSESSNWIQMLNTAAVVVALWGACMLTLKHPINKEILYLIRKVLNNVRTES